MRSRTHRLARGPTLHRQRAKANAQIKESFDLACACGEVFIARTAKDVLNLWRAHRHSAKEAVS